nr:30S ribosomal protein S1 [Anaerolineae bacterium]
MTSDSCRDEQNDFATLLEQSCDEPGRVSRGDLLEGTIVAIDDYGIIVDVQMKRDGVVPRYDLDALGASFDGQIGDRVTVMVVQPEDRDGSLIVSIQQALATEDWDTAETLQQSGAIFEGKVVAANRGGLIVPYGELRGFVPASHLVDLPRGMDDEDRIRHLTSYIGRVMELKVIEVNPGRRRLVFSQRMAQREAREEAKRQLLFNLKVGDIVEGRVSSLRDFGAFIDLGGADGLIHVSELAWQRVTHPDQVVKVGQVISVYILQLDREQQRIGLSLKRLRLNPWLEIDKTHAIGEMVEGTISRVVSFGVFVELDNGIEALLHASEMGEVDPEDLERLFQAGSMVRARIVSLEPHRQRMGLSIQGLEEAVWKGQKPEETDPAAVQEEDDFLEKAGAD